MSAVVDTSSQHQGVYVNTNGMPMAHGKNLHMEIGPGEIENRIITVGSVCRLEKIVKYFDADTPVRKFTSSRGFTTASGTFNSVPVSCVAIGMGPAMMDFFVRESLAVLPGPVAVIRFGTCGGISADAHPASVVVASEGAAYISRNVDAFACHYGTGASEDSSVPAYNISGIVPSCPQLSSLVVQHLGEGLGAENVKTGLNITADSFYSGQGRVDPNFSDKNERIVETVIEKYPRAASMEMESFMLLHLAKCSVKPVYATAAAIVISNRRSSDVAEGSAIEHVEITGALAMLKAITAFTF